MNFASDPSIERKISQMSRRVRWKHRELTRRGIDQTRVVINDNNGNPTTHDAFHFLVLGDSGTGIDAIAHPVALQSAFSPTNRTPPFCSTREMWSIWLAQLISTAATFLSPTGVAPSR